MRFLYAWSDEKNEWLQQERGLRFELVVEAADNGMIVDEFDHPKSARTNQRVLVIRANGYMVSVPYVTDGKTKFLKTMYYDRELQKKYGA